MVPAGSGPSATGGRGFSRWRLPQYPEEIQWCLHAGPANGYATNISDPGRMKGARGSGLQPRREAAVTCGVADACAAWSRRKLLPQRRCSAFPVTLRPPAAGTTIKAQTATRGVGRLSPVRRRGRQADSSSPRGAPARGHAKPPHIDSPGSASSLPVYRTRPLIMRSENHDNGCAERPFGW